MFSHTPDNFLMLCIRLSQICTFLPNNFFSKKRQLHPIIWIKSITENWKLKIFMHFFTCLKPFKVLLYNALCEMELPRKFEFFPIFHYKTILFSSESQFSMKNVFFWGTSCWCSSKIKKVEGGLISCNCNFVIKNWSKFEFSW